MCLLLVCLWRKLVTSPPRPPFSSRPPGVWSARLTATGGRKIDKWSLTTWSRKQRLKQKRQVICFLFKITTTCVLNRIYFDVPRHFLHNSTGLLVYFQLLMSVLKLFFQVLMCSQIIFTMAPTLVGPWSCGHPLRGWLIISLNRREQTCLQGLQLE